MEDRPSAPKARATRSSPSRARSARASAPRPPPTPSASAATSRAPPASRDALSTRSRSPPGWCRLRSSSSRSPSWPPTRSPRTGSAGSSREVAERRARATVATARLMQLPCRPSSSPTRSPTTERGRCGRQRWGGLRWVDMLAGDVLALAADGSVERRHVGTICAARPAPAPGRRGLRHRARLRARGARRDADHRSTSSGATETCG